MANPSAGGIHSGMQVHRLMARGFSRQGAAELLAGNAITQANDLTRAAAAMTETNPSGSFPLQELLDKQCRAFQILSNVTKHTHDTAKGIVSNIR